MDPASASLLFKAGGAIFSGVSAYSQAQAAKKQNEINAFIGRTRAMQADVAAREGLTGDLANMRSVLGANSQKPGVGTMEIFQELRETRNRERRVDFANEMQTAAGFRTAARQAGAQGMAGLAMGAIRAGPSLFDLYERRPR